MLVQLWKVLITYTKYSKVCINVDVAFNIGILEFDLRTDMHLRTYASALYCCDKTFK